MTYQAAEGRLRIALTGESMITRALRPFTEPAFLALRSLLTSADVAFTNGEMLFHDFEGSPAHRSATWMRCHPRFIEDLIWLGVSLVNTAHNHAFDYGEAGLLASLGHLSSAGMTHAGSGRNRAEAVAPAYLDTASGRVALIGATTSGRQLSRAGEQRPDLQGRPGTNLIRWTAEWHVPGDEFEALRRTAEGLGWSQRPPSDWLAAFPFDPRPADDVVYFSDRSMFPSSDDPVARYVRSDRYATRSVAHVDDVERNLRSIRDAADMADWVVFSIHNHEFDGTDEVPAGHIVALARDAIDAGADVVIGHGPHRDRGIEIYHGRPILYSLGNFIAQNSTVERLPQDALDQFGLGLTDNAVDLYRARDAGSRGARNTFSGEKPYSQSVVATIEFEARELVGIRLDPVDLHMSAPRAQAGRPTIATGDVATEILERMRRMSRSHGTTIEIDRDRAFVKL